MKDFHRTEWQYWSIGCGQMAKSNSLSTGEFVSYFITILVLTGFFFIVHGHDYVSNIRGTKLQSSQVQSRNSNWINGDRRLHAFQSDVSHYLFYCILFITSHLWLPLALEWAALLIFYWKDICNEDEFGGARFVPYRHLLWNLSCSQVYHTHPSYLVYNGGSIWVPTRVNWPRHNRFCFKTKPSSIFTSKRYFW